jgi:hypothetical protein
MHIYMNIVPISFTMLQAGSLRVRDPMRSMKLINLPILPAALGPGVYSASTKNEYQKQKEMFLGSRARPVRKADNLTANCGPIV